MLGRGQVSGERWRVREEADRFEEQRKIQHARLAIVPKTTFAVFKELYAQEDWDALLAIPFKELTERMCRFTLLRNGYSELRLKALSINLLRKCAQERTKLLRAKPAPDLRPKGIKRASHEHNLSVLPSLEGSISEGLAKFRERQMEMVKKGKLFGKASRPSALVSASKAHSAVQSVTFPPNEAGVKALARGDPKGRGCVGCREERKDSRAHRSSLTRIHERKDDQGLICSFCFRRLSLPCACSAVDAGIKLCSCSKRFRENGSEMEHLCADGAVPPRDGVPLGWRGQLPRAEEYPLPSLSRATTAGAFEPKRPRQTLLRRPRNFDPFAPKHRYIYRPDSVRWPEPGPRTRGQPNAPVDVGRAIPVHKLLGARRA
jgi:hypothetical protein